MVSVGNGSGPGRPVSIPDSLFLQSDAVLILWFVIALFKETLCGLQQMLLQNLFIIWHNGAFIDAQVSTFTSCLCH